MDERALPVYTVLLPLYKEKPATIRALFDALSRMDYPEAQAGRAAADRGRRRADARGDREGRAAGVDASAAAAAGHSRARSRGRWGSGCATRRARSSRSTTRRTSRSRPSSRRRSGASSASDSSVACLQAKLGYYNPRQNLLTRWFTLEYDAWFNIFLPRPAPHRRADPAGWHVEPLPARGAGAVPRLGSLQRHRGRRPRVALRPPGVDHGDARVDHRRGGQQPGRELDAPALALEQGLHADAARPHAPALDGCCASSGRAPRPDSCSRSAARSSRRCWRRSSGLMLLLWCYLQPEWIAALFPGPIYYAASICLVAGNFAAGVPQPLRGGRPWPRRPRAACAADARATGC